MQVIIFYKICPIEIERLKGAMRCLQAKPYKYRCSSCQAAVLN